MLKLHAAHGETAGDATPGHPAHKAEGRRYAASKQVGVARSKQKRSQNSTNKDDQSDPPVQAPRRGTLFLALIASCHRPLLPYV